MIGSVIAEERALSRLTSVLKFSLHFVLLIVLIFPACAYFKCAAISGNVVVYGKVTQHRKIMWVAVNTL